MKQTFKYVGPERFNRYWGAQQDNKLPLESPASV